MATYDRGLGRYAPVMLSVLRIVTGLLFVEHGGQKLLGFPPGEHANQPIAMTLPGLSGVFELVGGALFLFGLFTRPVAFVLSGMMAVAYWMVHAPQNPFPVNNGGDAAILYCFVFLYFVFAGAGPISIDGVFNRRRPLRV
jgi:putative oxidoreductase